MAKTFSSLADPEVAHMINSGAIGIIPTDTVYGLVAQASNISALNRFYAAKPRHNEPGTIIGSSSEHFAQLGFSHEALTIAGRYWPGAVSVVLDASGAASHLKHHRDTLPLRIPAPIQLRTLLEATGPLMTTSANAPGEPTAHTIDEARVYFGDTVDFYVDTGTVNNPPSTIIGLGDSGQVIIYREGAVAIE